MCLYHFEEIGVDFAFKFDNTSENLIEIARSPLYIIFTHYVR